MSEKAASDNGVLNGNNDVPRFDADLKTFIDNNPGTKNLFLNYLSRLWTRYSQLKLVAVDKTPNDGGNMLLPLMYVHLNTKTRVFIGKKESNTESLSGWTPEQDSYLYRRIAEEIDLLPRFRASYVRELTVVEMMEANPRLVLIGAPGGGKSTFLQYVMLCMAGETLQRNEANLNALNGNQTPKPWPHGVLLPIYIELRFFVRSDFFPTGKTSGTAKHLVDYISSTLLPQRDPDIAELLRKEPGKVLLMLDGLDEVQDPQENIGRLRDVITDFTLLYPGCRLVVSSRPYAYEDQLIHFRRIGFQEAVLDGLSESQERTFITRWYQSLISSGQLAKEIGEQRIARLITNIDDHPYLNRLASTPLLLVMMVNLNDRFGGKWPIGRAELYEESLNILLDRWNNQRGMISPVLTDDLEIDLKLLREKLERLAFDIHKGDVDTGDASAHISYEQLYKALATYPSISDDKVIKAMKYLHERSGIILADSPDSFRFPHRSFQEYLAACYLLGRDDYPDFLVRLVYENPSLWRDVLLFVAGRAAVFGSKYVWELVAELSPGPNLSVVSSEKKKLGAIFAGLVLLETKAHEKDLANRYQSVLTTTRVWLIAALQSFDMSPLERFEVGRILGFVGDPRDGIRLNSEGLPDIEWIGIPPGNFLMGSLASDKLAYQNEFSQRVVNVGAYRISKYPITVSQFRAYLNSEECSLAYREEFQNLFREDPETYLDNYPMVGINFDDAQRFCKWLEKKLGYAVRLPTVEQWEKAARGVDGRIFPWGEEFDSSKCNVKDSGIGRICAVGLFPDGRSPYGVMDMIGNVYELTDSLWQPDPKRRKDVGRFREIRGGDFVVAPANARCAYRGQEDFATPHPLSQGFRVITPGL